MILTFMIVLLAYNFAYSVLKLHDIDNKQNRLIVIKLRVKSFLS